MDWLIAFLSRISDEIIVSVISGIVVLAAQVIINYYKNNQESIKHKAHIGEYFLYFYHTTGEEKIIESQLTIRRHFGKMIATIQTFNDTYSGYIKFTTEHLYLQLSAKNHTEYIQIILFNTLFPVVNKMWGIGCCISVFSEPCAIRFLVTRKKLNKTEVHQEFNIQQENPNKHILTAKKDISLYQANSNEKTITSTNIHQQQSIAQTKIKS